MSKIEKLSELREQERETFAPSENLPAVPAPADDGWNDAAAESASNIVRGTLLKFADWRWTKGAEAEEVPIGTQLVAVGTAAAWVHWADGKPDKYIVRQPGKPLPDREEFGELDQSAWELGPDEKTPRDPWVSTRFVYFLDPMSVEMLTYSTSSIGGRNAVSTLADQITRMRSLSNSSAMAVVELGATEMQTKFGRKSKPVLKIVRWYGGGGAPQIGNGGGPQLEPGVELKEPSPAEEMSDQIPF